MKKLNEKWKQQKSTISLSDLLSSKSNVVSREKAPASTKHVEDVIMVVKNDLHKKILNESVSKSFSTSFDAEFDAETLIAVDRLQRDYDVFKPPFSTLTTAAVASRAAALTNTASTARVIVPTAPFTAITLEKADTSQTTSADPSSGAQIFRTTAELATSDSSNMKFTKLHNQVNCNKAEKGLESGRLSYQQNPANVKTSDNKLSDVTVKPFSACGLSHINGDFVANRLEPLIVPQRSMQDKDVALCEQPQAKRFELTPKALIPKADSKSNNLLNVTERCVEKTNVDSNNSATNRNADDTERSFVSQSQQQSTRIRLSNAGLQCDDVNRLSLSSWGLPRSILQKYHAHGIQEMFPWQAECLCIGNVLNYGNLVYSAPTSAGKTMVAELLMLKCVLERKKKAIFILPFVSVAREKVKYLQNLYQKGGVRVDGFCGNSSPPGGLANVDIAICTIERANNLMNRLLEIENIDQIGVVVVDELHMVGDSQRGYLLELMLTKLCYVLLRQKLNASLNHSTTLKATSSQVALSRDGSEATSSQVALSGSETATPSLSASQPSLQIIGMSATLQNIDLLARWLNADLYVTDFRPVPLLEMVKIGVDIYDNRFSRIHSIDKSLLGAVTSTGDEDHIIPLCLETVRDNCAVLIFCPTKNWCEKLADSIAREFYRLSRSLAAVNGGPSSKGCSTASNVHRPTVTAAVIQLNQTALRDVVEQLRRSPAGLDSMLAKMVPCGVAFHHAGLTFDERDIVEGAFRSGALKVLVATSTLSSGVNLPARRVIIRTPIFHGSTMPPLTYRQMIGRAGRKGVDTKGESILVCKASERKAAVELVSSILPPVTSCLFTDSSSSISGSMKRAILEIVVSKIARSVQDVELYARCTLLAASLSSTAPAGLQQAVTQPATAVPSSTCGGKNIDIIQRCIKYLHENELITLIKEDGVDVFAASQLGTAVISSGLSPDEGLSVFAELQKARRCFVLENDLHVVYLVTPIYMSEQLGTIEWYQYMRIWERLPVDMLRVAELIGVQERFLTRAVHGRLRSETAQEVRAIAVHKRFYVALILNDLINEMSLSEAVSKYGCPRGLLQSLQQSASTFAGMVTVMCNRLGWSNLELLLSQFQSRLSFGVQTELVDLVRISLLNAQRARAVYNGGYQTVAMLANAQPTAIELLLKNSAPFHSKLKADGEMDWEVQERIKSRCIWLTGQKGLTEAEAANLIILEARELLASDLLLLGVEWKPPAVKKKRGPEIASNSQSKRRSLSGSRSKRSTKKLLHPRLSSALSSRGGEGKDDDDNEQGSNSIVNLVLTPPPPYCRAASQTRNSNTAKEIYVNNCGIILGETLSTSGVNREKAKEIAVNIVENISGKGFTTDGVNVLEVQAPVSNVLNNFNTNNPNISDINFKNSSLESCNRNVADLQRRLHQTEFSDPEMFQCSTAMIFSKEDVKLAHIVKDDAALKPGVNHPISLVLNEDCAVDQIDVVRSEVKVKSAEKALTVGIKDASINAYLPNVRISNEWSVSQMADNFDVSLILDTQANNLINDGLATVNNNGDSQEGRPHVQLCDPNLHGDALTSINDIINTDLLSTDCKPVDAAASRCSSHTRLAEYVQLIDTAETAFSNPVLTLDPNRSLQTPCTEAFVDDTEIFRSIANNGADDCLLKDGVQDGKMEGRQKLLVDACVIDLELSNHSANCLNDKNSAIDVNLMNVCEHWISVSDVSIHSQITHSDVLQISATDYRDSEALFNDDEIGNERVINSHIAFDVAKLDTSNRSETRADDKEYVSESFECNQTINEADLAINVSNMSDNFMSEDIIGPSNDRSLKDSTVPNHLPSCANKLDSNSSGVCSVLKISFAVNNMKNKNYFGINPANDTAEESSLRTVNKNQIEHFNAREESMTDILWDSDVEQRGASSPVVSDSGTHVGINVVEGPVNENDKEELVLCSPYKKNIFLSQNIQKLNNKLSENDQKLNDDLFTESMIEQLLTESVIMNTVASKVKCSRPETLEPNLALNNACNTRVDASDECFPVSSPGKSALIQDACRIHDIQGGLGIVNANPANIVQGISALAEIQLSPVPYEIAVPKFSPDTESILIALCDSDHSHSAVRRSIKRKRVDSGDMTETSAIGENQRKPREKRQKQKNNHLSSSEIDSFGVMDNYRPIVEETTESWKQRNVAKYAKDGQENMDKLEVYKQTAESCKGIPELAKDASADRSNGFVDLGSSFSSGSDNSGFIPPTPPSIGTCSHMDTGNMMTPKRLFSRTNPTPKKLSPEETSVKRAQVVENLKDIGNKLEEHQDLCTDSNEEFAGKLTNNFPTNVKLSANQDAMQGIQSESSNDGILAKTESVVVTTRCRKTRSQSGINIIDVAANRSKFQKFLKEWTSQTSFGLCLACELYSETAVRHNVIGSNFNKGKAVKKSVCGNEGGMEDEGLKLNVVGLAISWNGHDSYFVSLSQRKNSTGRRSKDRGTVSAADETLSIDERLKHIREILSVVPSQTSCNVTTANQPKALSVNMFDTRRQFKLLSCCCDIHMSATFVKFYDPKIASWLLDPDAAEKSLSSLVMEYCAPFSHLLQGLGVSSKHVGCIGLSTSANSSSRVRACTESLLVSYVMNALKRKLEQFDLYRSFVDIEMPCLLILARMELNGMGFNAVASDAEKSRLRLKQSVLERQVHCLAGHSFSLASLKDVSNVLFIELKLPPTGSLVDKTVAARQKTYNPVSTRGGKKTTFSSSKEILEKLKLLHPLPGLLLDWRRLSSALNKVIHPLEAQMIYNHDLNMYRIYGVCYTCTATGRVTMFEPNIQNIAKNFTVQLHSDDDKSPGSMLGSAGMQSGSHLGAVSSAANSTSGSAVSKEEFSELTVSLRDLFVPFSGGVLIAADYSQLELRILAHLSSDKKLISILNHGGDIFKTIAAQWKSIDIDSVTNEQRQHAKQVCYGMIYGIGAQALSEQLLVEVDEAASFMESFKMKYPGMRQFLTTTVQSCRECGYITMLSGRRRYLPAIKENNMAARSHAERQAVNSVVQGSAADLVKKAMIRIDTELSQCFPNVIKAHRCQTPTTNKGEGATMSCDERISSGSASVTAAPRGAFFILQLHDELIYEANSIDALTVARIIKHNMETALKLSVQLPVKLKMGPSWGSMTEMPL